MMRRRCPIRFPEHRAERVLQWSKPWGGWAPPRFHLAPWRHSTRGQAQSGRMRPSASWILATRLQESRSGMKGLLETELDSDRRQARAIPTTTQCLDQENGRNQALAAKLRCQTFIGEQLLLGSNHIEICNQAAAVARIGERQRP